MIRASIWLGEKETTKRVDLFDFDFCIEFLSQSGETFTFYLNESPNGLQLQIYSDELSWNTLVKELPRKDKDKDKEDLT